MEKTRVVLDSAAVFLPSAAAIVKEEFRLLCSVHHRIEDPNSWRQIHIRVKRQQPWDMGQLHAFIAALFQSQDERPQPENAG